MEEKQLLIKALERLENGDVLGSAELLGDCYILQDIMSRLEEVTENEL